MSEDEDDDDDDLEIGIISIIIAACIIAWTNNTDHNYDSNLLYCSFSLTVELYM